MDKTMKQKIKSTIISEKDIYLAVSGFLKARFELKRNKSDLEIRARLKTEFQYLDKRRV
jgi:hypothetical protein